MNRSTSFRHPLAACSLGALLVLGACSTSKDASDDTDTVDTDTTEASLYQQLGGETAVRAVVAEFLSNVGGDATINWMFANTDLDRLGDLLHDQICAATGGGCTYGGATMAAAHEGMAITDAQFDALVGDLLDALDTLDVPYSPTFDGSALADPLITTLAGMRGDIVEDADGDQVYFNQLGGHASVEAVVDGLITRVAADSRINGFFASTDLDRLNDLLVEQICDATGGFCTYAGRDMMTAHAGLCIGDSDFDALVEDLLATLDDLGVPYSPTIDGSALADPLLQTLSGMRADIVEDCAS
ncbi:MAG: group 1 truncated hemoglobin [Alphaproteobacteria bacterium]|nr:group 1 truncated hemoglobin [Alphaproteobacteria bacterium]